MSREWEGELRPPGETPIEHELAEGYRSSRSPLARLETMRAIAFAVRLQGRGHIRDARARRVHARLRAAAVSQHVRLGEVVRA
jgi:hypothetical protein